MPKQKHSRKAWACQKKQTNKGKNSPIRMSQVITNEIKCRATQREVYTQTRGLRWENSPPSIWRNVPHPKALPIVKHEIIITHKHIYVFILLCDHAFTLSNCGALCCTFGTFGKPSTKQYACLSFDNFWIDEKKLLNLKWLSSLKIEFFFIISFKALKTFFEKFYWLEPWRDLS